MSERLEHWTIEERSGLYIAQTKNDSGDAWVTCHKGDKTRLFFSGHAHLSPAVIERLQQLADPAVEQALSVPEPAASEREGADWSVECLAILDRLDHAATLHADTMRFQVTYASEDLGHYLAGHRSELRALLKAEAGKAQQIEPAYTASVWVVHSPAGWPVDVRLFREEAEGAMSHDGETVHEYRPGPAKQETTCACRAYGTDGLHYATCELRRSDTEGK